MSLIYVRCRARTNRWASSVFANRMRCRCLCNRVSLRRPGLLIKFQSVSWFFGHELDINTPGCDVHHGRTACLCQVESFTQLSPHLLGIPAPWYPAYHHRQPSLCHPGIGTHSIYNPSTRRLLTPLNTTPPHVEPLLGKRCRMSVQFERTERRATQNLHCRRDGFVPVETQDRASIAMEVVIIEEHCARKLA